MSVVEPKPKQLQRTIGRKKEKYPAVPIRTQSKKQVNR